MKTITRSLKVLSLATMVLFFSNCTKDSDEIIPETTQNQGTNNGNTNNGNTNTNNGNTGTDNGNNGSTNDNTEDDNPVDALFDDSVNYAGDALVGDWSISSMEYALEEGGSTSDANGSGSLTFNADGTGSRSYVYTSSVTAAGSYYTVDEEFEWRRYSIDATDDTPEIQKVQLRGASDVTWTVVESSNSEQVFSFVAIPNNTTHYYTVSLSEGLPENYLVGDWTVDDMTYKVVDTGDSDNCNAEGAISFNADGTGSREYTFQSAHSGADDSHLTKDESFTWWLVGNDKIKIDNGTWVETWNRTEDTQNMQQAMFMLNIPDGDGGSTLHEFTITFMK